MPPRGGGLDTKLVDRFRSVLLPLSWDDDHPRIN